MTVSSSQAPASGISHVDALRPGARLAEFEILSLLGVGGFGMVYKAFDHSLHRAVAIKEYMPSALAGRSQQGQSLWVRSSSDQHTFQAGLSSFVGEARLLAQFDHPSLVKVFRFWEANNTAYMVMPLYSGMTFKQARTQMRAPPPETWLRKMLWAVLSALRVLHDGKTLHRDISPDNIFLQDNGPPVLLDLGAARHAINDEDRKHTAVLKVNYAPIEQYSDGDEDLRQGPWSDLYSLAAVVHGCLCNDTPLPATLRTIRDRMVPFSRVAQTVKRQFGTEYSAPFVGAISQALSLRPEDRPQSIDAFLQAMEMTSPPVGMQHFDYQADLGDIWIGPADPSGSHLVTPTVDVRSESKWVAEMQTPAQHHMANALAAPSQHTAAGEGPDTVASDRGDTVFADTGDTVADDDSPHGAVQPARERSDGRHRSSPDRRATHHDHDGARPPASPVQLRKRSPLVWLVLASVVVVAAAAGLRWAQQAPEPEDDIITEMAQPPVPATPADAVLAADGADPSGRPAPALGASEPAVAAQANASTPVVVKPVPRTPPRRVVAAEPVPTPAGGADISSPEPPVAPPATPRASSVARIPTPEEVCAGTNFLARPLCVHEECQKPAQVAQPICVENRRRYEADEQRRRMTPN